MEISVDTRELVSLERRLALAGKATEGNARRMLTAIGTIVLGKSRAYAPRSMTKSEYVATLKGGKTKRATSSFTSGSLKSSITSEVFKDRVEIGVPSNSKAGAYAEKVHETWKPTPHNDSKATDQYIFKAAADSEREYMKAVDDLVDRIIKAI
jgi:hypothetical protein